MSGLRVLAEARWPAEGNADEPPPVVAGYLLSTFNPLVADVAERCLAAHHGERPALPADGADTAIVLVSASGDATSAEHVAATVDDGRSVGPLFFFQSVPNSIAGYVAARWGLAGPVTCLCPTGDPMADGLEAARLLLDDGAARSALVICVEQGGGPNGADSAAATLVTGDEHR